MLAFLRARALNRGFLGGSRFSQDTQRDPVQMRGRLPVEVGKRPLVGKRGPRQQIGERGIAVEGLGGRHGIG